MATDPTTDSLEIQAARLERALELLDRLERHITRAGGYMEHTDQLDLREARAFLVEVGKRKSVAPPVWHDRVTK